MACDRAARARASGAGRERRHRRLAALSGVEPSTAHGRRGVLAAARAFIAAAALFAVACGADAPGGPAARVPVDDAPYTMGLLTARGLQQLDLDDDEWEAFATALQDHRAGGSPGDLALQLPRVEAFRAARAERALYRERESEAEWLAEAAAQPDSEVLQTGAVMRVIERGDGRMIEPRDAVELEFTGRLRSGVVFDGAGSRAATASFRMGRMILCWSDAFQRVPVGSELELTCPAATAHGAQGLPPLIPAGAALRYDIKIRSAQVDPAAMHGG